MATDRANPTDERFTSDPERGGAALQLRRLDIGSRIDGAF
jgi:hypothetical protein